MIYHEKDHTVAMTSSRTFARPQLPVFQDAYEERSHVQHRLVLACRIIHRQGWGIGCSVHLSARDPVDTSTIYVLPAHTPLAGVRQSDLVRISIIDGSVILSGATDRGYDAQSVALHRAVYSCRADVGGVIHGSSPNIRAFAMTGQDLEMILQDSCTFHTKIARLPLEANRNVTCEPTAVGTCLRDGKGMILDKQGILLVGAWIEPCISYYIRMESLCRCQLLAQAAARTYGQEMILIGEEEVAYTAANNGSEHHAWLHAKPYFDREARFTKEEEHGRSS